MGMDVHGRKPKSKTGEYFRANVWAWRPINRLVEHLNRVGGEKWAITQSKKWAITQPKTFNKMACNDGAGLVTNGQCQKMADRIEAFLAELPKQIRPLSEVLSDPATDETMSREILQQWREMRPFIQSDEEAVRDITVCGQCQLSGVAQMLLRLRDGEIWLEYQANGLGLVTAEGRFLREEKGESFVGAFSAYGIPVSFLQGWVAFLRDCGGFRVC